MAVAMRIFTMRVEKKASKFGHSYISHWQWQNSIIIIDMIVLNLLNYTTQLFRNEFRPPLTRIRICFHLPIFGFVFCTDFMAPKLLRHRTAVAIHVIHTILCNARFTIIRFGISFTNFSFVVCRNHLIRFKHDVTVHFAIKETLGIIAATVHSALCPSCIDSIPSKQ